jgi:hypothetical protein
VSFDKFLKLFESFQPDLIARLSMQPQLDAAIDQFPR